MKQSLRALKFICVVVMSCVFSLHATTFTELFNKIGPKATTRDFFETLGREIEEQKLLRKDMAQTPKDAALEIMEGLKLTGNEPFSESMLKNAADVLDNDVFKGNPFDKEYMTFQSVGWKNAIEENISAIQNYFTDGQMKVKVSPIDENVLNSILKNKGAVENVLSEYSVKASDHFKPFEKQMGAVDKVIEGKGFERGRFIEIMDTYEKVADELAGAEKDLAYAKNVFEEGAEERTLYENKKATAQTKFDKAQETFKKDMQKLIDKNREQVSQDIKEMLGESEPQKALESVDTITKLEEAAQHVEKQKIHTEQSVLVKVIEQKEKIIEELPKQMSEIEAWTKIKNNNIDIETAIKREEIKGFTLDTITDHINNSSNGYSKEAQDLMNGYKDNLKIKIEDALKKDPNANIIKVRNDFYFNTLAELKKFNLAESEFPYLSGTPIATQDDLAKIDFSTKNQILEGELKEASKAKSDFVNDLKDKEARNFEDAAKYHLKQNQGRLTAAAVIAVGTVGAVGAALYFESTPRDVVVTEDKTSLVLPQAWQKLGILIYRIPKALAGGVDDYVIALRKKTNGTLEIAQVTQDTPADQYISLVTSRYYDGKLAPLHKNVTYGITADGKLFYSTQGAFGLSKQLGDKKAVLNGTTDQFTMYMDADINPIDMRSLGSDVLKNRVQIALNNIMPFYADKRYQNMAKLPQEVRAPIDAAWKQWKQAYKNKEEDLGPSPLPPVPGVPELDVTIQELLSAPEVESIPGTMLRHLRQAKNGKYYKVIPEKPQDSDALIITTYNATAQAQDSKLGYVYSVLPASIAQRVATSGQGYEVTGQPLEILRARAGVTVAANGKQTLGVGFETPNISLQNLVTLEGSEVQIRTAVYDAITKSKMKFTSDQRLMLVESALSSLRAVTQAAQKLTVKQISSAGDIFAHSQGTLEKFYFDVVSGLYLVKVQGDGDAYYVNLENGVTYNAQTGFPHIRPVHIGTPATVFNQVLVNVKDANNIALVHTDAKGLKRLEFQDPRFKGATITALSFADRAATSVENNQTMREYALFAAIGKDTANVIMEVDLLESPVDKDTFLPSAATHYTISEKQGDTFVDVGTYAYDARKLFAPLHYYSTRSGGIDKGFVPEDALQVNPTVFIWNGDSKLQFTQVHYDHQLVTLQPAGERSFTGNVAALQFKQDAQTYVDYLELDPTKTRKITITQKTNLLPGGLSEEIVTLVDAGKEYRFRYTPSVVRNIDIFARDVTRLTPIVDVHGAKRLALIIPNDQMGLQVTSADIKNTSKISADTITKLKTAFDAAVVKTTKDGMHLLYVLRQDDFQGKLTGLRLDLANGLVYNALGMPFMSVRQEQLDGILNKLGVRVAFDDKRKPYLVYYVK